MAPKLSDLVRDWAVAAGWPITVIHSKDIMPLDICWVETAERIPICEGMQYRGSIYVGTVHNDEAYFVSARAEIVASHPHFFRFIAEAILDKYMEFPLLDKSKLPYGGDRQLILDSCTF